MYQSWMHACQAKLIMRQYYKPWETSADEDDRVQDQIAEAHEIIKREVEDYKARQEHGASWERHASPQADGSRDAKGSHSGKERDADASRQLSIANGDANGSHTSPKDQDMEDDHAEDPGDEAVRVEATEHVLDGNASGHETTTDDASNDNHDENGEDVVEEAAEDTVIY
jgi:hypothetical protein